MKFTMILVFTLSWALFSISSFATKIMIRGAPTVVYEAGGVYHAPDNYTSDSDYNYIILSGMKKVCYLKPQPNLSALDKKIITVDLGGIQNQWICYNFDNSYFSVIP